MASAEGRTVPTRERRPSTSAPIVDIQGSVSPAGISRPKHKRTFTGFGAGDIKNVEGGDMSNPCADTTPEKWNLHGAGGRLPERTDMTCGR